ncbi:MAG: mRNA surveillance protein pelota [Nanoarchaeota archaeon]|mgnify:CR=1 FL=1
MKILKKDLKNSILHVQITTPEDLWYLSQIIEPWDHVTGKTERKLKIASDKVIKKTLTVTIEVERVEFSQSTNQLRILGKVISEHEDIPKGSYHTLEVEQHAIIKIQKKNLSQYTLLKLEDAEKSGKTNILMVVFDREEATFALLKDTGLQMLDSLTGEVEKKQFKTGTKEGAFYDQVLQRLQEYDARFKPSAIIIASPAFFKEDLLARMKKETTVPAAKVHLATCSHTGPAGIQEVLKRDELQKVLQEERMYQETQAMEEFLKELATGKKATYGLQEVQQAVNAGAVRKLLVAESLIQEMRSTGTYDRLDKLIRQVSETGGKIIILSKGNDPEKKLMGLTGIAAVLRFAM